MVCAIVTAIVFASPEYAMGILFGSGSVVFAATPVAAGDFSIDSIEDTDGEYLAEDISQYVTKIRPNKYPYSTLLQNISKGERAKSFKVQFEEYEEYKRDGLVTEVTAVGGQPTRLQLEIADHLDRFLVDDLVRLPFEYEVGGSLIDIQGEIISRNTGNNTIIIENVYTDENDDVIDFPAAAAVEAEVNDGMEVFRYSVSKSEKAAQTTPRATIPVREFNYIQHFMFQVEQSVLFQQMSAKSGHNTFSENQRLQIENFRSELEYACKMGQRGQKRDVNVNELKWTMAGMNHYIDKDINYTIGALTDSDYIDWGEQIFADNNGSEERFLFADGKLLADILKTPAVQRDLAGEAIKIKRGLRCKVIESNFGVINLVHDTSWKDIGYRNYGLVVDPMNVRLRDFYPMQVGPLKLKESGQKWVDANVCHYVSTLEVRHKATHARIVGQS